VIVPAAIAAPTPDTGVLVVPVALALAQLRLEPVDDSVPAPAVAVNDVWPVLVHVTALADDAIHGKQRHQGHRQNGDAHDLAHLVSPSRCAARRSPGGEVTWTPGEQC
jgi:hypothetical protein